MAVILNQYNDMELSEEMIKKAKEGTEKMIADFSASKCPDMALNRNDVGHYDRHSKLADEEGEIVRDYVVKMIGDLKGKEAWEIYFSVFKKYQAYINKGFKPSKDFDIKELLLEESIQ